MRDETPMGEPVPRARRWPLFSADKHTLAAVASALRLGVNRTGAQAVGCRQFVATASAFAAIRRRAGLSGFPTGFFGSSSTSVMTSGTFTFARLRRQ